MSTEVGSIHYTLKLDRAAFDSAIDSVSNRINNLGGDFEKSLSASKAFTAGIIGVGVALFGIATKSTLTAARTETLGIAMEAVAKATRTSMETLKEQEAILKKQGITTQEARSILTKFMQSQLDVAQAAKIAQVAQDLAVIAGENSSETAGRLTDAIATQNVMLLRQVGIVTTSSAVFDAYAKSLNKSADDLTDVEKRQAMVNLILREGKKVAGTYEAAMGTAGKQMASLKRYFEEAENAIGERFLPVFGKLIAAVTEGLKMITPENIDKFVRYIEEHQAFIFMFLGGIAGGMFLAAKAALAMAINTALALAPYIAIGAVIGGIIYVIYQLIKNWDKITETVRGVVDSVLGFLGNLLNTVRSVFQSIVDFIVNILNQMGETWIERIGFMIGFFLTLPVKVLAAFGALIVGIVSKIISVDWRGIFRGILDGAKSIFNSIITAITSTVSRVATAITTFDWKKPFRAVLEGAKNIFRKIPDVLTSVLTGAVDIGKKIANAIIGFIEGAIRGALAGLPGGIGAGFKIPRLAAGGIVTRPSLVVAGEAGPEAILPLGKAALAEIHIHAGTIVASDMSVRELARAIQRELDRNAMLRG